MPDTQASTRIAIPSVLDRLATWLRACIEVGVLLLVCLSPWAFGCIEPEFEAILYWGLATLVVLWGLRTLLEQRLRWTHCPVVLCLAGLFVIGILQVVPVSPAVLASVSPGASRLTRQLLPENPEVLPFNEPRLPVSPPPDAVISLYPTGTWHMVVRILAVFLLFALVRNNLATPEALHRVSLLALINGSLLAFLGLAQFLSSSHDTLYWTFQSAGAVFGPFINRNHFAFYINLCIGLGTGLLFYYGCSAMDDRAPFSLSNEDTFLGAGVLRNFSLEPAALWTGAGVALLVASNVMTLSRGGLLAMLVGTFGCVGLAVRTSPHLLRLGVVLLVGALAGGLLLWFGIDVAMRRYETIWSGAALGEGRTSLWASTLPWVREFYFTGTGYGTFQQIEPMHRTRFANVIYEHAHNEYLEALVEGGLPRLVLTVLAIGLTLRLALFALGNYAGRRQQCLIFGALFAVISAAVHSVGEFAVHIPAVMFLTTVIAAMLCGLSNLPASTVPATGTEGQTATAANAPSWLTRAIACYAAACAPLLAFVIATHGWKLAHVQQLRRASWNISHQPDPDRPREIAYLEAAATAAPDHAQLQLELASLHLETYDELNAKLAESDPDLIQAREKLARSHLVPALQRFILARDLCPLLPLPHYQIAANAEVLDSADPRPQYLARVKLLAPGDPEIWYLCGVQEFLDNKLAEAWKSWRRSLELSDEFLTNILDEAVPGLDSEELISKILPDRPALLLAVALRLYPEPEAAEQRRVFLEKALDRLNHDAALGAYDWSTKARIHTLLNQPKEALATYESGLARQPDQIASRYEYAALLFGQGRLQNARRELEIVLGQQPNHADAKILMEHVGRAIAAGKVRPQLP